MGRYRPHDLLWLAEAAALKTDDPLPAWAEAAWVATSPVVVRRAAAARVAHVAVGLRGAHRHERCAAEVRAADVLRVATPEDVARLPSALPRSVDWPCLQTLRALAPILHTLPWAWGVTGGVGFTLASGIDVLRDDSDLDLLIRAASPADADALRALAPRLSGQPARVDVQVETPLGAFTLREWLRTGGPVLLKTAAGPRLVDDPWHPSSQAAAA